VGHLCWKYEISAEDANECYSKGWHTLLEAIHSGKFTEEYHDYSLVKFLSTCCKNHCKKLLYERKRMNGNAEADNEVDETDQEIDKSSAKEVGSVSALKQEDDSKQEGNVILSINIKPDVEELPLKEADPTAALEHKEDLQLMEHILDDLPYPCKDLIWGKYRDGFPAEEMAWRLGYSGSRVAITTLSRCMKKLRNRFLEERNSER